MPLRLELKPYERLIINGAAIRNGDRRTSMLIETPAKLLRESDIIVESEADTSAKRIYVTLMVIYLADDPAAATTLLYQQLTELLALMPSAAEAILAVRDAVDAGTYYPALKAGKALIAHEARQPTPKAA